MVSTLTGLIADQTLGYGGTATVVDLDTESTRFVDRGSDGRSFDATDCP
ncbi:hypothetical protein [Halorubrum sp. BOL3-1]|nr:hypothetical protein [Halorubrum sp. BOL3-1]